jgi:integrase
MSKRPRYLKGIGVFRGKNRDSAWLKIHLPHGGEFRGESRPKGASIEIKVGDLKSWGWEQLAEKHAELQGRADRGEPLEDKPLTLFRDFAAKWLERAESRVRNFETEEVNVRLHLLPTFGPKALNAVTRSDVNVWLARQRTKYKAGTVKRHLSTLKAILNDAVREGELDKSPCQYLDRITGAASRPRFLEPEEIVRLLAAANQTEGWLYDAIVWALHSGMRRGEIQSLLWSDIKEIEGGGKVALLHNTKGDRPRSVICTTAMLEVLERQAKRIIEGDVRVWPVSAMTWRRRWEICRERAGLSDVNFHDLRRTNATQAAVSGVDLRTLAGRIGHADLAMLEKHYAIVVGSAQYEAAQKIQTTFERLIENVVPLKGKP